MLNIGHRPWLGLWLRPFYRDFVGHFNLLLERMRRVRLLENARMGEYMSWGKEDTTYSYLDVGLCKGKLFRRFGRRLCVALFCDHILFFP